MYDHALFGGWQTRLHNSPAATNADAKLFKRLLAKPRGCLCRRTSRADPQVQVAVRRGLRSEAHHRTVCSRKIRAFDLVASRAGGARLLRGNLGEGLLESNLTINGRSGTVLTSGGEEANSLRLPPLALGKEASRTETVSGKEAAVLDLGAETVVMSHAKLELLIHELRRAQESLQNCL